MAYIRCSSGGGGAEVIEGTVTGAAGNTSAGEFTITSQQGKAPASVTFWNTNNFTSSYSSGIFWSDSDSSNSRAWYGGTASTNKAVGAAVAAQTGSVKTVGSMSVTVACPSGASYYTGTWKYIAVFE